MARIAGRRGELVQMRSQKGKESLKDYQLLDTDAVAELLSLSVRTVEDIRWRVKAGLRSTRVGDSIRFRAADVKEFIDSGLEDLPLMPSDDAA